MQNGLSVAMVSVYVMWVTDDVLTGCLEVVGENEKTRSAIQQRHLHASLCNLL